jgi:uncharacterized protein HemY
LESSLTALPAAFEHFNGFYTRHANYILYHQIHNLLAQAIIALAVLIFIVWGVRRLLRRRRNRKSNARRESDASTDLTKR